MQVGAQIHVPPEHQGCLKEESHHKVLSILVWRCALVLSMDGRKTHGDEGGPTQASGITLLGVGVPKDSGDTWGRVRLASL